MNIPEGGNAQDPPAGGDPAGQAGGGASGSGGTGAGGQDPQALANQVGFLTRKLAEADRKLKGFEEADQKRQQDAMSELDRAKQERDAARAEVSKFTTKAQDALKKAHFLIAAGAAGAQNAEDAFRLADLSQVHVDENDQVHGVDAAVAALKQAKAYLFGTPKPTVGSGGGNPPGPTPGGRMTAQSIKDMPAEEFRKLERRLARGDHL